MTAYDLTPVDRAYIHWFDQQDRSWSRHPRSAFQAGWYAALDHMYSWARDDGDERVVMEIIRELREPRFTP
jgi:hypothetical protein